MKSYGKYLTLALVAAVFLAFAAPAWAAPGDLDPSFDGDGKVTTDMSHPNTTFHDNEGVSRIAVQPDGKIVAVGIAWYTPYPYCGRTSYSPDFAVARYNINGTLDSTFGTGGKVTTNFGWTEGCEQQPTADYATDVAIDSQGRIVVVGESDYLGLARYNPDGTLDTSFDGDGKLILDANHGGVSGRSSVAIQPDGKIVVTGSTFGANGTRPLSVARVNDDGSLDNSFGAGGVAKTQFGSANSALKGIAIRSGKILVAGTTGDAFALARLNADGSLDTSFSGDGHVATAMSPDPLWGSAATDLLVQPDDKIVATGWAYQNEFTDFAVARYNPNGTLDNTFSGDGKVLTKPYSPVSCVDDDFAYGAALQSNGKILVSGSIVKPNCTGGDGIVRYKPDGTLDDTFSGDGKLVGDFLSGNDLAVQKDGKVLVGGQSGANWNRPDFFVARYEGDPPDTTAPTVSATSPVDGATNVTVSTNVTVTFSEEMSASTITGSTFTLIKQGATSPVAATVTYDSLTKKATLNPGAYLDPEATYTATVKGGANGAKDRAGNALSTDKVWSFTMAPAVDTTAPTVSLTAPADGAIVSGPVVALSADAQDNVGVSKVEFRVDGNLVGTDTTAPYSVSWNSENVSDGRKSVTAKAFDAAGNQKTSVARSVVVDNFFPNTTITAGPAEGSLARSTSASFSFSATDSAGGFRCKLDDKAAEPCSSGKSYSGLSQGRHTFSVWAIGSAGETIDTEPSPAIRTWTVDSVKPRGTVKINGGAATTRNLKVRLALSATDPSPGSGVSSVRISNDGRRWSGWQPYTKSKLWKLKVGKAGTRVVYVQYRDRAGNVSATARDTIKYRR